MLPSVVSSSLIFISLLLLLAKSFNVVSAVASSSSSSFYTSNAEDGRDFPLSVSKRIKSYSNGTFILNDAQMEDEGWLRCQARNKDGQTAAASLYLDVVERPVINPFIFGSDLREGMRTIVVCSVVSGELPLVINWYKDGNDLRSVHPDVEILRLGDFTSSLRISSIARKHTGNYTCKASHAVFPHISTAFTAFMSVSVSPHWQVKPRPLYHVISRKNILIDCQSEGIPAPTHQWKKLLTVSNVNTPVASTGSPDHISSVSSLSNGDLVAIVSGPHMHVLENGSLSIVEASKSDEGDYVCEASNGVGTAISSVTKLQVNLPVQFLKSFDLVKGLKGSPLLLTCDVLGDNSIQLSWSKDAVLIKSSLLSTRYVVHDEVKISNTPDGYPTGHLTSRLTVATSEISDSGLFTCTAWNHYGRDERNIQVVIEGPPEEPSNIKATDIKSRSISLSWSTPSNSNSPLVSFLIQYTQANVSSWNQGGHESISIDPNENSATISGLKSSTSYKIRVYAVNALGRSGPSSELLIRTEEEEPHEVASNIRTETLNSASIRVHWSIHTSSSASHLRAYEGFHVGYREITSGVDLSTNSQVSSGNSPSLISSSASSSVSNNHLSSSPTSATGYTFKTFDVTSFKIPSSVLNANLQATNAYLATSHTSIDASSASLDVNSDFYVTLTDLKRNTHYGIIVRAFNRKGVGPSSEEVVAVTAEYDAPQLLSVKAVSRHHHSINLSWEQSIDTPVTGYIISYRSLNEAWEEIKISGGKRNSYLIENLRCGTKYQLTVTAYNKIGKSTPTELISVSTAGDVPSAPSTDSLVKSNATFAFINLATWADHGCSIMNFALQYKLHLSNDYIMLSNNIIPEQKSIFLSDLLPASWYDVIMTAFSEAGSTEAQYQFATLTVDGATIPPPSAIVDTTWEILLADPMILIPISCTLIVAAGILLIVLFLAHRNCTSEILFTHSNGSNGGCSNRSPSHHTSVGTFSQQALHLLTQHQPSTLGFHETQYCTLGGLNSNLTGNSDPVRKCESITMSSFSVKNCQVDSQGGNMQQETAGANVDDTLADEEITDFKGRQSPSNVATLSNRTVRGSGQGSCKKQSQHQQQQQQQAALLHLYSHANGTGHNSASSLTTQGTGVTSSDDTSHHQLLRSSLHHPVTSNDHIYDMPNRMSSQLSSGNANSLANSSSIEINDGSIILLNNPSHSIPSHLMQQMTQHPHHLSYHLHSADSTFSHDTPSDFEFDSTSNSFHVNTGQKQSHALSSLHQSAPSNASSSGHKQASDINNRIDFVHIFDCPS